LQPVHAWLARADEPVEAITCPDGDAQPHLGCRASALALQDRTGAVTVKVKGYQFVTQDTADVLPKEEGSAALTLNALPEAEQTVQYTTALSADDAELFATLSAPSSGELGKTDSLKFYIADLDTQPVVYFQDTRRFSTHYSFVHDALHAAGSPNAFEAATYHGEDRNAMAGTVTWYHDLEVSAQDGETTFSAPYVLSFFSSDDLSPELVRLAHRLVEERLGVAELGGTRERLLYVPAGQVQLAQAEEQADTFAGRGVPWARTADLYAGVSEQRLNFAVAYGTLRALSPEELETSALSFRDILVLQQLPVELPLVGGTITAEPQTPLAHVNLLAHARGTPNLSLLNATEDERVAPFLGELVRFEVTSTGFSITAATSEEAEEFWSSRLPPLFTPQADLEFTGLPLFDEVGFDDSVRVGSKAANLGELRQLLGDAAPPGFAIPFSAYQEHLTSNLVTSAGCDDAFVACTIAGRDEAACEWASAGCQQAADAESSLEDYLAGLLVDDEFIQDSAQRDAGLAALRELIETSPVPATFGSDLNARVAELVGDGKVKLRSSTNVEDLENFSGAGLYESYRARATGDERASWVVRKVWSSAWTFGAFEERAWWNVDQSKIAMGVAVNPAVSDEQANGVLITGGVAPCGAGQTYVNVQVGEESVTNPTGNTFPEAYCVVPGAGGEVQAAVLAYSSLSPSQSILSQEEVVNLEARSQQVVEHFAALYGTTPAATSLDMEFKFRGEDRTLLIKQVRPFSRD
jgi:pyruvate, water dikinase